MKEGWGLEQYGSEFWKKKYWTVVSQFSAIQHQIIRASNLEELNQSQAKKISELELLLSCIHRKGDTVYIDHKRILRLLNEFEPTGLASSRYVRNHE